MSDTAYEPDGEAVVSISAPAEPVTNAFESESQAQEAEDARYAERLRELEGEPRSEEYRRGVIEAASILGYGLLEPGEPGYVEQAQAELAALREQRQESLRLLDDHVQQAMIRGDHEAVALATELLEGMYQVAQQQAFEQEAAAAEDELTIERGEAVIEQTIADTTELVGADEGSVDPAQVAELAADVFVRLIEQYGLEAASALVPELIQKTVAHVSDESEAALADLYEKAERLTKDLGNAASPGEVVDLGASLYQRELYHAGGDATEAARSSLMQAVKAASGFSDKSQPLNMSVASLHASLNRAVPRATPEQPKLSVKLDQPRDARTGKFIARPLAETYAVRPKSEAEKRTDAQKQVIREAFSQFGCNPSGR